MADSPEKDAPEVEAEEAETPDAPVIFLLKSVVRGRSNRTARAAQPGRMPFVQNFAGGSIKVRRARPARITEAALLANLVEIKKAVSQHKVVVTTMSGRIVDLSTAPEPNKFQVAQQAAEKPLPNPPLDSAKNDKNTNIGYDVPPTPEGTTMSAPEPELLKGTQAETSLVDPLVPSDSPVVPEAPVVTEPAVEAPSLLPPEKTETSTKSEESHKHSKGKGKRG